MYCGNNKSKLLKFALKIIILCNCISKSCSLEIVSETESVPYFQNVSSLDNLARLPNNYLINMVSEKVGEYLTRNKNEDILLNGTQLIQKYGYKVEEHHVTTSDGYILTMYRIPGKGRVVFLMHGILCSFVDWITVGPSQGLPYLLATQGYDVWMGNARGNTFSRKNKRLSPSNPTFWDFSFDEIGSRDLPAMIDHVLAKTQKKKITYIGHSLGTTAFFVLCSTQPEYNNKIDFMIALSPVAWMKHITNPIFQITSLIHNILYSLFKSVGLYEIAPDSDWKKNFTVTFCGDAFFATVICESLLFLVAGFDYAQMNYYQLPVIFNHFPSGSSLMLFEHYAQLVESGYFRKFDHGSNLNFKIYGSVTPPSYPVNNITVPIAIFFSQGDWLSCTTDVDNLRIKLKHVVNYSEVRLTSFNHYDYLWARHVKRLVYDKVLSLIKHY